MIEECSVTGDLDRIHQEHAPGMSCGKLVDDLAMVQGMPLCTNNSIRAFKRSSRIVLRRSDLHSRGRSCLTRLSLS